MNYFKRLLKDYIESHTTLMGSNVHQIDKNVSVVYNVKSIFDEDELELIILGNFDVNIRITTSDFKSYQVYNVLDDKLLLSYCTKMMYNKLVPTVLTILREYGMEFDSSLLCIKNLQEVFISLGGRL